MKNVNFYLHTLMILFLSIPIFSSTLKFSDRPKVFIVQIDEKKSAIEKTDNEKWFSSFLDAYLNFRIGVSSNFDIITKNELKDPLSSNTKFSKKRILELAQNRKYEHLFLQTFYFPSNSKINFYGEYIDAKGNTKIYEKDIQINNIGQELDSIAIWYLSQGNLFKDDKELDRFFKMKIIPDNIKEIIKTGEILNIPSNADSLKIVDMINQLHEAVARDPKNLLASYSAANLYEQIGDLNGAAKEQNDLLVIIPFYAPLYSHVVRNFRITGNSQKALTFAGNAEKKGIINPDLLLEGAITLEEIGIDRQASRAFYSILKLDPFQKRALLYFARTANRERHAKKALEFADSILTIDSIYGEALLEKGRAQMLLADYEKAIENLTRSTAFIKKPYEAMLLLGEIHVLQQSYEKGALFFENAIKNGAISIHPYIKGANAWILAQKNNKAYTLLQSAHNLYPNNPDIKKEFALISFTLKDSSEALELFEEYTKKFKQDPDILFPMGDIYTAQKNFQRAFFCFNQASQLTDDQSYANLKLGMFYLKKGDYIPAEKYLNERLTKKNNDPVALSYLGEVKLKSGKQDEALQLFLKARESGYTGTYCTEQIGLIYFSKGEHKKAFTELSTLENIENDISDLYYRLAVSSLFLKERDKAIEYLHFASNNERATPSLLLKISEGFVNLNDEDKAIDVLLQATKVYPKDPEILIQLSGLLEQKERYPEAAENLVKLFNISNARYGMQYAKAGFLYEKANISDSAISIFNNFLSKGYENDKVVKHLAALEFSKGNFKKTVELLTKPDITLRKTENKQYLGEALFFLGNYGEALPYLKEIATQKKGCSHCQANLAATYDALQQSDNAIKYYNVAIPLSTDEEATEYSFRIANIFLRDDNISGAENKFKSNISVYPNDLRNYDALINIYSEQREWGKAAEMVKRVLALPNTAPFYMKKLAFYYNKQNNRIEEEKILKDYIKLNPKDEEALTSLAYVNYDRELYKEASEYFILSEKEKKLNPNNTHSAAISFLNSDNTSEAIKYFSLALERGDSSYRNQENLIHCYRSVKDTINLIKTLESVLNSNKRDKKHLFELGVIYTEKDSIQKGISLLEEASKQDKDNGKLHILLAKLYKSEGNNQLLLSHLSEGLKYSSSDPEALTFAGKYYRETGDSDKSFSYLNKALKADNNYGEALYEMGLYKYSNQEYDSAVAYSEKAIDKAAYIDGVYRLHALILNNLDKHNEAITYIQKALNNDSANITNLIAAGRIFFGAQNNDLAKNYILKAITISQENIECFELTGDIYVQESAGSKAAEFYRKALKISGYNEQLMFKLGDVLLSVNESLQAQRIYSTILKNTANSNKARFKLVFSILRENDIISAKKISDKFQKTEQKEMWHELTNGIIALAQNNNEVAYSKLSIAYKLGPDLAITNTNLADILIRQNKYDQAIDHLEKSLNINPFNPFALLLMGQAYEAKGDLSTAFNIYKKVSDKYSMIPETYRYLAGLRSKESKHDSAVVVIEKGLKVDPENGALYLALGRELVITGKNTDAFEAYKKSIKFSSTTDKIVYLEMARFLYKDLSNAKEAVKYAKKFLKSGGTEDELKNASLSDLEL